MTEVSPIVVARVARRVSRRQRRGARAMLYTLAISASIPVVAIACSMQLSAPVMCSALFAAASYYMYGRRDAEARRADRIAEAAETRRDLSWTHERGVIQAHDHQGPRPTLALAASPRPSDVDAALPAARVV